MIGHAENFYDRLFDTPMEQVEEPYGVWMRAEPRRRMHTIGAKWLRLGGISPMENTAMKGGDMTSVNGAGSSQINVDSGIREENLPQKDNKIIRGNNDNVTAHMAEIQIDLLFWGGGILKIMKWIRKQVSY